MAEPTKPMSIDQAIELATDFDTSTDIRRFREKWCIPDATTIDTFTIRAVRDTLLSAKSTLDATQPRSRPELEKALREVIGNARFGANQFKSFLCESTIAILASECASILPLIPAATVSQDAVELAKMVQEPIRDAYDQYHDWHDSLKAVGKRILSAPVAKEQEICSCGHSIQTHLLWKSPTSGAECKRCTVCGCKEPKKRLGDILVKNMTDLRDDLRSAPVAKESAVGSDEVEAAINWVYGACHILCEGGVILVKLSHEERIKNEKQRDSVVSLIRTAVASEDARDKTIAELREKYQSIDIAFSTYREAAMSKEKELREKLAGMEKERAAYNEFMTYDNHPVRLMVESGDYPEAYDVWYRALDVVSFDVCGRSVGDFTDGSEEIPSPPHAIRSMLTMLSNALYDAGLKEHTFTKDGLVMVVKRLLDAEATIAKLPRTADGVPIVPGMKVWVPKHAVGDLAEWSDAEVLVAGITNYKAFCDGDAEESFYGAQDDCHPECDRSTPAKECYSTESAARAAQAPAYVPKPCQHERMDRVVIGTSESKHCNECGFTQVTVTGASK